MKNLECEVFNTNNPYDEAGEKHNVLLAEIERNGNSNMDLDEVFELSDKIIKENYGSELVPSFSSREFATPIISFGSYDDMQKYVRALDITEREKSLNLQLYDIMLAYDATNLCEVINSIKNLENQALIENPKDITSFLVSASIGRYSLSYWNDRVQGDVTLAAKGFWKKLFTGVSDAIGGAAGAVAASATVIGAIGGAIVGGGAASAAFSKAWDLFAE